MPDLLHLVTLVAFFALMVAFVRLCERIVGKDGAVDSDQTVADVPEAIPDQARADPPAADATPEEVPA